jgi:hypothetical protein
MGLSRLDEDKLRILDDMHGQCSLGTRHWAAEKIRQLDGIIDERHNAEHYGPYGTACMNTGQFDAGECWLCYAKRKKKRVAQQDAVIDSKLRQIEDLTVRAQQLNHESDRYKQEAAEMQLVAGRYQYLHEQAMKALNKIEDVFEYQYGSMTPDQLRVLIQTALADFTDEVKKVVR